jgi:hypothetical protein
MNAHDLSDERIERLADGALDRIRSARHRKRLRNRVVALAGAGALVAAVSAGTAVVLAPEGQRERVISCFASASTGVPFGDAVLVDDTIDEDLAIEICATLWRQGVAGVNTPDGWTPVDGGAFEAPELEAIRGIDGMWDVRPTG